MVANPLLDAALSYADDLGWSIIDCHYLTASGACSCGLATCGDSAGKHPRGKEWEKRGTSDPDEIARRWARFPLSNVGIIAGPSNVLIPDLDVRPEQGKDGVAGWERILAEHEHDAPPTREAASGGGAGRHLFYSVPAGLPLGRVKDVTLRDGSPSGVELRAGTSLVVLPPSSHPKGQRRWLNDLPLAPAPQWMIDLATDLSEDKPAADHPEAPRGAIEALLRALGLDYEDNGDQYRTHCPQPGCADRRVSLVVRASDGTWHCHRCESAGGPLHLARDVLHGDRNAAGRLLRSLSIPYPGSAEDELADKLAERKARPVEPQPLERVVTTFRRHLYMPDEGALLALLAAVAANLATDGDPVWLLVVAPPGGGKTEMLAALRDLEHVHYAATITEAALLSGTPTREKQKGATGGLLREVGEHGVLVLKDFTSIISMHRDARASTLAALREVYDGAWTRRLGTDGGKTLHWEGRLGLVAGCTPAIDSAHAVVSTMGERFAYYRLEVEDRYALAEAALAHAHTSGEMRRELSDAVRGLFAAIDVHAPPRQLTPDERRRLIHLGDLATLLRSAVDRDPRNREIDLVPDPEAPTRFAAMLSRLVHGLRLIGAAEDETWRIAQRVALDSAPKLRVRTFRALLAEPGAVATRAVADAVKHPTTTTRRALEELYAHGLVARRGNGEGHSDEWEVRPRYRRMYADATTVPETSEGVPRASIDPDTTFDDISGTVSDTAAPHAKACRVCGVEYAHAGHVRRDTGEEACSSTCNYAEEAS